MRATDHSSAHRSSPTVQRAGLLMLIVLACCGLVAGASPAAAQSAGSTLPGAEPLEDMVVIVRAVTAILAIALAMALVLVLTPGAPDDE